MEFREHLGERVGGVLAWATGFGAAMRHARLFHPVGLVARARVVPVATIGPEGKLAQRLAGPAIARLSNAWWKTRREWPDVLGLALRLRSDDAITTEPAEDDQDILFATIRWPITTPVGPLGTDAHDFLANDLHGVAPFEVPGLGYVKLRMRAPKGDHPGRTRDERLQLAMERDEAVFVLQVRQWRFGAKWQDIARVELRERVTVDQERLRFSPFRTGRGVIPRGFVQALRGATYAASRAGSGAGKTLH